MTSKHADPDTLLLRMPSLRAVKAFVAAAKYKSFTRAAEALCVSQAAISRQIRELETFLDAPLFMRSGRTVELTAAGAVFFEAAQLSFVNIAQAADRIRNAPSQKHVLTVCCSPAFSALWLSQQLPDFRAKNPDIELNLVTTQNFVNMEPGVVPDIIISKIGKAAAATRTTRFAMTSSIRCARPRSSSSTLGSPHWRGCVIRSCSTSALSAERGWQNMWTGASGSPSRTSTSMSAQKTARPCFMPMITISS